MDPESARLLTYSTKMPTVNRAGRECAQQLCVIVTVGVSGLMVRVSDS